jgi:acyl-ACP thioesterase
MHSIEKGNDVIPERYGAAWIYTRYHVKINRKIDYNDPLLLKQWIQPYRRPLLLTLDSTIEQRGELVACGKIETCVFDLNRQLPRRLSSIDFPDGIAEEVENDIPSFIGLGKSADGLTERYRKTVRVSDLDKSRHMNNLRYIEMFQDAYESSFWSELDPHEMEIRFLSQCKEGETVSVCSRTNDTGAHFAALHQDGTFASTAFFGA